MSTPSESKSEWVVETTSETFQRDVFERSRETPVVVDFWSRTCQPCLMLAPILEGLAEQFAGQFVLVKAEAEHNQQPAADFQVRGIPAVFAVVGGEVVDFFEGLLPAEHVRGWIDRMLLIGDMVKAGRLEESDPIESETLYRKVLEAAPNESAATIGLARALLNQKREDDCRAILEKLERRGFLEPEAEKLKASLHLAESKNIDVAQLRAEVESNPDDLPQRHQLAEALASEQKFQEALDICLDLVQRDRQGVGEQARQTMVDIFRVLPDESPLTGEYRRKLASALY
ncbi:MAG: tetratricopeptide repeat protein [Pirellulaceae bacterium]